MLEEDIAQNPERAAWAALAMDAFKDATNMHGEDNETIISDLLCDLMHFCDEAGLSYADCNRRAWENHVEEHGQQEED